MSGRVNRINRLGRIDCEDPCEPIEPCGGVLCVADDFSMEVPDIITFNGSFNTEDNENLPVNVDVGTLVGAYDTYECDEGDIASTSHNVDLGDYAHINDHTMIGVVNAAMTELPLHLTGVESTGQCCLLKYKAGSSLSAGENLTAAMVSDLASLGVTRAVSLGSHPEGTRSYPAITSCGVEEGCEPDEIYPATVGGYFNLFLYVEVQVSLCYQAGCDSWRWGAAAIVRLFGAAGSKLAVGDDGAGLSLTESVTSGPWSILGRIANENITNASGTFSGTVIIDDEEEEFEFTVEIVGNCATPDYQLLAGADGNHPNVYLHWTGGAVADKIDVDESLDGLGNSARIIHVYTVEEEPTLQDVLDVLETATLRVEGVLAGTERFEVTGVTGGTLPVRPSTLPAPSPDHLLFPIPRVPSGFAMTGGNDGDRVSVADALSQIAAAIPASMPVPSGFGGEYFSSKFPPVSAVSQNGGISYLLMRDTACVLCETGGGFELCLPSAVSATVYEETWRSYGSSEFTWSVSFA